MKGTWTIEKMKVLLPHWIEHNRKHEAEFQKWAASARAEGAERLAALVERAAANIAAAVEILKDAQSEVGCFSSGNHAPDAHTQ